MVKVESRIGFLGGGQMALALGKGFMQSGLVAPSQVMVSAPTDTNLALWRELGAQTTHDNADVVLGCDVIFLAVKPHIFPEVLAALEIDSIEAPTTKAVVAAAAPVPDGGGEAVVVNGVADEGSCCSEEQAAADGDGNVATKAPVKKATISATTRMLTVDSKLFVSVMAGITLKSLQQSLSNIVLEPRIIRAHPNTPAMVGCGCAVYSLGEGATSDDGELVKQLFSSVGICEKVPESQQDAFTGMAGSGPAYIYTVIEALSDGGVRMGLPRQLSARLAAQMTMGAAKMALESGKHTGQLKDDVTSPSGTTIRGIQVLERAGVRGALMDAVEASAERAAELGAKK